MYIVLFTWGSTYRYQGKREEPKINRCMATLCKPCLCTSHRYGHSVEESSTSKAGFGGIDLGAVLGSGEVPESRPSWFEISSQVAVLVSVTLLSSVPPPSSTER
jgi:hypothetical protein